MKEINEDPYNFADVIASNDSVIQALQLKKSCNDSLLNSNVLSEADSLNYLDSNNSITNMVSIAILQNNSLIQQFIVDKADKIETAKDLNDEISPSTTMETNEKTVNDIYLRTLAQGDYTLSETDYNDLLEIANQCPFYGGRAVFEARAILAVIGESTQFDDETVCSEDEEYRKAKNSNELHGQVYVSPSPAIDHCKFIYQLPKDEKADLNIYDGFGKTIYHSILSQNSRSFYMKLDKFPSGVYIFIVHSSSGLVGNGKLIIIR